jgi:tRNA threonylcarbamoyladenosine biosynthesis protein TsaE
MRLGSIFLADEGAAVKLGAALAPGLQTGDIICLEGPLGAGKTTCARGLIKAFCGAREVPSPTFTLVETYQKPQNSDAALWHFDLYRLERPRDVYELGFEDALGDGICLIEWSDRIAGLLPAEQLRLVFHILQEGGLQQGGRRVDIEGSEMWRQRLEATGLI